MSEFIRNYDLNFPQSSSTSIQPNPVPQTEAPPAVHPYTFYRDLAFEDRRRGGDLE